MKRGAPLRRLTALKAKTPMKRGSGLARTQWNPKPTRDSAELRASKAKVRKRSRGLCEAGVLTVCTTWASDFHHVKTRARGGSDSPANGLDVCRACHDWIDRNQDAAHGLGLLRHSWDREDD